MKTRLSIAYLLLSGAITTAIPQVPQISSVTPTSGAAMSGVIIGGSNFGTNPGANTVFFGGVRAVVTGGSASTLDVIAPIGVSYDFLTVVTGGGSAVSPLPFDATYAGTHVLNAGSFASPVNVPARDPYNVAEGDFDGDGRVDIVASNQFDATITVYRNIGSGPPLSSGSFAAGVTYPVGNRPVGFAVADLDGDGKLDLAVSNYNNSTVSVLRNASTPGSILFESHVDFLTGPDTAYSNRTGPFNVAAADINGDGKLDLLVANDLNTKVSVLQNASTPGSITPSSFLPHVDFFTGNDPFVLAGDIDGDGRPDLAVANWGDNNLVILRNTTTPGAMIDTGSFAAPVGFATLGNPFSLSLGDLDGDGKLDVVVPDEAAGSVSVLHNESTPGSPAFGARQDYAADGLTRFAAIGDLDGDGKPDLAAVNRGGNNISIYKNQSSPGSVSFVSQSKLEAGVRPRNIVIADFDNDRRADLYVANEGVPYASDNTVSIFRNSRDQFSVQASAGPNGSVSPSGDLTVNYGDDTTITMIPEQGFKVSDLHVDSVTVPGAATYTFTNVTSPHTFQAEFCRIIDTIFASSGPNGTIYPPGIRTVTYGSNKSYTATPDTGYHIDSLIVDGSNVGPLTDYTFTNVVANHTIRAVFAIDRFTITAAAGAHGSVSPTGVVSVNYGDSLKCTVTPDTGYHVDSLIVDGAPVGALGEYTFTHVTSNHTIRAVFAVDRFTIIATAGLHGAVSPDGVVAVTFGSSQSFTFTPDTGYHIDSVFVDGSYSGTQPGHTFSNVDMNHVIHAVFAIDLFTITATAGAHGSISPGGTVIVAYGTGQSYAVAAGTGYHIDSLIVDGTDIGTPAGYAFTNVTGNHTIRAVFAIDQFSIAASAGPHGAISPGGAVIVNYASDQSFTVTPDTGYHVDSLFVDGAGRGPMKEFTFRSVTANHTIRAVFDIDRFTITASADTQGAIVPNGTLTVNYGSSQTFVVTPSTGYHVDSLLVDGVDKGALTSYTFLNVSANHTIHAEFGLDQFTITATAGPNGSISPAGSVHVTYGGNQTFTITPATGYHVDSVLVDGANLGALASYAFPSVSSDHTIHAEFSIDRFTITSTAGAHGSVTPAGAITVNYGADQKFIVVADSSYHIDSVLVDGSSVGAVSSFVFSGVTANHTITAGFSYTCPLITIAPDSLPVGEKGVAISETLKADGGTAPYTFQMTGGSLPSGVGLNGDILEGVPADSGHFSFTIGATDARGCTAVRDYAFQIFRIPKFIVSDSVLKFGHVNVGSSRTDSVTVSNPGSGDLIIASAVSGDKRFVVSPASGSVAAGQDGIFHVTFLPDSTDSVSTTVTFAHNAAGSPHQVGVAGVGVAPMFVVSATHVSFGGVILGQAGVDTVAVSNPGSADLVIKSATSADPAFAVSPGSATIAPGTTAPFAVTFAPTVRGVRNTTLTFSHNAGKDTAVALDGTGVVPVTVASDHRKGWNMVSNPVLTARDSASQLFPAGFFPYAFDYDSSVGYVNAYRLKNARGYWQKFTGLGNDSISGFLTDGDTVFLNPGWNMVGSVSAPVQISTLEASPAGTTSSHFYGYSGGYTVASTIEPGRGYWLHVNQPSHVVLNSAAVPPAKAIARHDPLAGLNRLRITDGDGNCVSLAFSVEGGESGLVQSYMLPPVPPEGMFDARFGTGSMVAAPEKGKSESVPVSISSARFPLTIAWEMSQVHTRPANLILGSRTILLERKGFVTVAEGSAIPVLRLSPAGGGIPTEFSISQNYPNPFNPTTLIEYALPREVHVTIRVYNLLGAEIGTLVDEVEPAGKRYVQFDGSNLSTGVYFYRIQAGSFSTTRRMLLVR